MRISCTVGLDLRLRREFREEPDCGYARQFREFRLEEWAANAAFSVSVVWFDTVPRAWSCRGSCDGDGCSVLWSSPFEECYSMMRWLQDQILPWKKDDGGREDMSVMEVW